jgi:hypothetical protein
VPSNSHVSTQPAASSHPQPTDKDWARLDTLGGVVLQTALVAQIAALTFGLQFHGGTQVVLFGAAALSFVAVLSSMLGLGVSPTASANNRLWRLYGKAVKLFGGAPEGTSYSIKNGYTMCGLYLLLAAVEAGTLFAFFSRLLAK